MRTDWLHSIFQNRPFNTPLSSVSLALMLGVVMAAGTFKDARAADKTLTVYTYESFTSEWGPGPKIAEAFAKTCACKITYVSVADGVELLTRLKLEGPASKADVVVGLDTNLVAEAKATGFFAKHGLDQPGVTVSTRSLSLLQAAPASSP